MKRRSLLKALIGIPAVIASGVALAKEPELKPVLNKEGSQWKQKALAPRGKENTLFSGEEAEALFRDMNKQYAVAVSPEDFNRPKTEKGLMLKTEDGFIPVNEPDLSGRAIMSDYEWSQDEINRRRSKLLSKLNINRINKV